MRIRWALAALTLLACSAPPPGERVRPTYRVVWSDEFDGPAGTQPDERHWTYDEGNRNGWGNQELQNYTRRPENVAMDGAGHLVITARAEPLGGFAYTSARIKTQGKVERQYGRFEARINLPTGRGIWPAFWMLGGNIAEVGWPTCGEIDIMEHRGAIPTAVTGALHGPGHSGGNAVIGLYRKPDNASLADNFHVYAVEWEPDVIRFYVDDELYQTVTSDRLPGGARWVYDRPFFMILNVAVGGTFGGDPDATTMFPQSMQVDWVRIHEAIP